MRLTPEISFPHPVIGPMRDDVTDSEFSLKQNSVKADGLDYYIDFEFGLTDCDLLEYIRSGQASYALHVEARGFFYRKLFDHLAPKSQLKLGGGILSGKVDCLPLVISVATIPDYRLSGFHEDYGNVSFELKKGEILAIGNGFSFEAEKEYDSMEKLSSIMQVLPDDKLHDGAMEVDLSGEKITVFVSKKDREKYSRLQQQHETAAILLQSVAVPALTSAIAHMKIESEESIPTRWQKTLKRKADVLGISIEDSDSTGISCRILDGPFGRMLSCLDNLVDNSPEDDDE